MNIFFLEDNPEVFPVIDYLRSCGHNLRLVRNLRDAAYCLELEPGADSFDIFFFDVGLPAERVDHFEKGEVTYKDRNGFNGLIFLLHNLDLLHYRTERVAIVTAYRQIIMNTEKVTIEKKSFSLQKLSAEDDELRVSSEKVPKIQYKDDTGNIYGFAFFDKHGANTDRVDLSFLDKGEDDIISQIDKFINRG